MKSSLLILLTALLFAGCKKEVAPTADQYFETVKKELKDNLLAVDNAGLNFNGAIVEKVDSVSLYIVRIPFTGSSLQEDFVVVKTNQAGHIEQGKIVHLQGGINTSTQGGGQHKSWDGAIDMSSLNRTTHFHSAIVNGYITAYHQQALARTAVLDPGLMPEVVIVSTIHHSGIDVSSWMMLQSFFYDSGGSSWGNYYGSFLANVDGQASGGVGGGPTGVGGSSGGSGPSLDPTILIDVETMDTNPAIDLQKFINCFTAIPDDGATCSIEIMTDIPVDSNPNAFYDLSTGSPGHTFISLSKDNGTQHVTQNIGFYPKSGYKSITYAPVASKLVDNADHEFNASLRMNLTPARFATALNAMQQYSNTSYDVDEYNCTDFALNVLNAVRAWPLVIPKYGIPGSPLTQATRTPGGLYNKLQEMVTNNDPEKANITIGIYKGYAGGSHGPCN